MGTEKAKKQPPSGGGEEIKTHVGSPGILKHEGREEGGEGEERGIFTPEHGVPMPVPLIGSINRGGGLLGALSQSEEWQLAPFQDCEIWRQPS